MKSDVKPDITKALLTACLFMGTLLLPSLAGAQTILVLGDSLSSAYNMSQQEGWVNLLQQKLTQQHPDHNYRVINSSTSGDTTAGGLSRLPAMLEQYQPKIIIVELGGNDGLRGLPLKHMKHNLSRMIELANQNNARMLLAGIHIPPNYGELFTKKFYQVYLDLAKQPQVTLIPFLLENVGGVSELIQPDGLHPNAKAQPIILDNVWTHLQPLLGRVDQRSVIQPAKLIAPQ